MHSDITGFWHDASLQVLKLVTFGVLFLLSLGSAVLAKVIRIIINWLNELIIRFHSCLFLLRLDGEDKIWLSARTKFQVSFVLFLFIFSSLSLNSFLTQLFILNTSEKCSFLESDFNTVRIAPKHSAKWAWALFLVIAIPEVLRNHGSHSVNANPHNIFMNRYYGSSLKQQEKYSIAIRILTISI